MKELEVLYEAKGHFGAGGFGRGGPVRPGGRLPHLSHPTGPGHAAGYLADFYDRGRSTPLSPQVTIYDELELGRRNYYLFEVGPDLELGTATLERGPLGRYKIVRMGWGGGNFKSSVEESGGEKYLLIAGGTPGSRSPEYPPSWGERPMTCTPRGTTSWSAPSSAA